MFSLRIDATWHDIGNYWLWRQWSSIGTSGKGLRIRVKALDILPLEDNIAEDVRPVFGGSPNDMDAVISQCDFLSLHVHLAPATRHIIGEQRLGLLKPTTFLVNVVRGALVDEDALGRALLAEKIAGAGIDVFAQEPPALHRPEYSLPNFIVTPHVSGQTDDTVRNRFAIAAENARRLVAGEEILNLVNKSLGFGKK